jgi:hypothetical protein
MAFRYEHEDRERVANDIAELERALRAGELQKTTLVLDEAVGVRLQAGALIAMKQKGAAASAPAPKVAAAPKDAKPAVEEKPARVGLHRVVATLVAFGAYMVVAMATRLPPTLLSNFVIAAIVVLFLVVTLSGWIFGRKTGPQKVRQAWVGAATWILVWVGLGLWVGTLREERVAADRVAAKAIADSTRRHASEMEALATDKPAPQTSPPPSEPVPALVGSKGTLMQRIAPVTAATQAATLREVREYKAFQDSLELEKMFGAKNITSIEGRKKNRETIDRYLAGYEAHHQRLVDLLKSHRQRLLALVENEAGKAEFTKGVDGSMATTLANYDEMLKIQRASAAQMHAVNDYVTARGNTVVLQDGKMMFATTADLDGYRKVLDGLDELAKQEDAVRDRQIARAKQAADKIEALPGK